MVHAESQFCHRWFKHVPHSVLLHQLYQHSKCFFFWHLNTTQAIVKRTYSARLTSKRWLSTKHIIFVPLQSHLQLLSNSALKCLIRKVKEYHKGMELTSTDHLSVCMDAAHLLSKNENTGKKSTEILLAIVMRLA